MLGLVGRREGSGRALGFLIGVEESIDIARSPESVWAFVSDPRNDPRWCRKVKSVEPTGDGRWRVLHKPVPFRLKRLLEG
jgi:hypothetical protein